MQQTIPVIFVIGPTASGKTAVSYELAKMCGGQIINVDVGQFYEPLSIGTAKPDWRNQIIKAHLFDICKTPEDFSVMQYRHAVLTKINELLTKGIVPIVVGGSLFYVQSLFFPPQELEQKGSSQPVLDYSWQALAAIDPVRAAQVHHNDTYRIKRALDIWASTGQLPSQLQPQFNFNYPAYLLMLTPDREILRERIAQRTVHMLEVEGWIDEAAKLIDTEWEPFIRAKGLLGYDLIFDALRHGNASPSLLAPAIVLQTTQYAKRQCTFLRGFAKKILALRDQKKSIILHSCVDHADIQYSEVARQVAYLQK